MIPLLVAVVLVVGMGCTTQMSANDVHKCRQHVKYLTTTKDKLRSVISNSDDAHVRMLADILLGEYITASKPYQDDNRLLTCWSDPDATITAR